MSNEDIKRDVLTKTDLQLTESKDSDVDGEHIIGKVRGQFFVPEGFSRNKRFYPRKLWENVISDEGIQERLSNRNMFGTIGHGTKLDDYALLEGKFSHIVTDLEIDENNNGIGEALILNTSAGRVLKTLLGAKCSLYTSSRADGKFEGYENGVPKVSPSTYKLETFDFVTEPGFLEANPSLVEELQEDLDDLGINSNFNSEKGEQGMSTQLVESITKEKAKLETKLENTLDELSTLKEKNAILDSENKSLTSQNENLSESADLIARYKEVGTVEEVREAMKEAKKLKEEVEEYRKLGETKDIQKVFDNFTDYIKERDAFVENYGDFETVGKALDESKDLLEKYKELGTVSEIDKVFNKFSEQKRKERVSTLANETGFTEERISTLIDKDMSDEDIKSFLEDFKQNTDNRRYKKSEKKEETKSEPKEHNLGSKSSGQRLMETFSR